MDYFRKYLGGQQDGAAPTGAETVERLCDRVQSSTLLEDRRDAVRALKSLSKKFRFEVGSQGMDVLVNVLETDRSDGEIAGYTLETLCNIMSTEPGDEGNEGDELPQDVIERLASEFTETFMSKQDNVSLLLSLLEEYDFHVRWPTVRLLTLLLSQQGKSLQEAIMMSPMGVSKLMDLLADSREIIRNDGLLLLIQLTKGNASIQKIVAFESGFERLLDIINDEGSSDGGIVVEDCLLLLLNLLKNNSSNQNFFKEGSFIPRLPSYFQINHDLEIQQGGWSAQKVTNIHLMLQVIRTLVAPGNATASISSSQRTMHQCGLLHELCTILMASGVPADVLTETINTVSEVIRGSSENQEFFASVMAPSNPPRPAIVVLLMSMVNEKQPFVLRCAVLYCFQSFLYKNELGQSQIVQTLLPSTADANSISAGQLLCGGLFSADSLSTWFAATALLHAIVGNANQKEQLLRVQLATSIGNPPVSLLQQCSNILAQGGKVQTRIGLLMLLCHWMENSTIATTHFLHSAANVPFLISQVSATESDEQESLVQGICAFMLGLCVLYNNDQVETYTRAHLRQVIEKRIGLERFTEKLNSVARHESYTSAAKRPQLSHKVSAGEVLLDHEFTRLFKSKENEVLKAVNPVQEKEEVNPAALAEHESVVAQYKELIREQDCQLNSVKADLSALQSAHSQADKEMDEMKQQVQQLRDQNALLKAQHRGSSTSPVDISDQDTTKKELDDRNREIEQLRSELSSLRLPLPGAAAEDAPVTCNGVSTHDGHDELSRKLEQREEEVKLYRSKFEEVNRQLIACRNEQSSGNEDSSAGNAVLLAERNTLSARISEQEGRIRSLEEDKVTLTSGRDSMKEHNDTLQQRLQGLESDLVRAVEKREEAEEESTSTKKEQEELLVLLADQDTKINTYQDRLKALGEQVSDDDDDDFDDDDEEEDDDDDNRVED